MIVLQIFRLLRRQADEKMNVGVLTTSNQIGYTCSLGLVPDSGSLLLQFQACSSILPMAVAYILCLPLSLSFFNLLVPQSTISVFIYNLSVVLCLVRFLHRICLSFYAPFSSLHVAK